MLPGGQYVQLTNQQARRLILQLQGLCDAPNRRMTPEQLHDLIDRLGYVQLDSIQWVERAQHMILFARNQTYRPNHLKTLLEKERALFEHWTHDACILPVGYFPYWKHRFTREKQRLEQKFENWQGAGFKDHCSQLIDRISDSGELMSRDLDKPDTGPLEMWQWHDGKAALEYLWHTGELCIHSRRGFQKVYHHMEQGIPAHIYGQTVSHAEFIDWACRAALDRLGFGTAGDIARYFDLLRPHEVQDWLKQQDEQSVIEIHVDGWRKNKPKTFFARPDLQDMIDSLAEPPARLRILSPFDPVIRNRARLEWLYGFEYRIEIYVPEHKRRWGYYVFPILEKDRLTGRIDMRANRKDQVLEVKKLWWEKGVRQSRARDERLYAELQRQCRLTGMKDVVFLPDSQSP